MSLTQQQLKNKTKDALKKASEEIEKIIIGPSFNQEDVFKGVKQLLQNNYYSVNSVLADVEIVKSVVPFRS